MDRPWHRHYEPGVPADPPIERLTLPQLLARAAARHPRAPALLFRNLRMGYGDLAGEVARLSAALAGLGVGRGTRVAIHLPNLPQTVIAYHAVLAAGGVVVMTNPMLVPREIEEQWTDAGVELAVTADFLYKRVLFDVLDRLPARHYVVASVPEYLRFPLKQIAPLVLRRQDPPRIAKVEQGERLSLFGRLAGGANGRRGRGAGAAGAANGGAAPPAAPAWDDLAVLQYTGGTTGASKAAMLTHANLSTNAQQVAAWFTDLTPGREVVLTALPLFHVFGLTVCLNFATLVGGAMVLIADPRDTRRVAEAIVRHRVTRFPAVPTLYANLNALPGVGRLDLSSVRSCVSGSAPLPRDVLARFEALTGARIVEGFGMTECSPVSHVNPVTGRKVGSVGVPICGTDARVVAHGGPPSAGVPDPLPPGETGELWISGPQVMSGYWRREQETARVLRDGWLATGDLATMDEDGYFRIVGRAKDLIIAGGFNVYPDEIDRLLAGHPDVVEACTIGVPDATRGETVKTFVVLAGGLPDDAEAASEVLTRWCRERLARYKVPRLFEFRTELPKSAVLKLLRRDLREQELARARARRPA